MLSNIKIAISGKSGCGNSTVSRLVAQKLNLKLINYTFHDMAKELKIDFKELCLKAEKDSYYDKYLDAKQIELASSGNCVLGSRLAIWVLKDADLKVYLEASAEIRAGRVFNREGINNFDQIVNETRERDKRDHERFLRLYNIDNDDYKFADLIIQTDRINPDVISDIIINKVKKQKV